MVNVTTPQYLAKLLFNFSKLLMMFMGVSKLGEINLMFIIPGVKINGTYCRDVLLTEQLLPVMRDISGDFLSSCLPDGASVWHMAWSRTKP